MLLRTFVPLLLSSLALAQNWYSAALEGAQEVPPAPSAGRGFGIVRHDPVTNDVRIFVWYDGLTAAPFAAHLHQAAAGVNGPIIVGLTAVGADTYTGTGTLTAAQATALGSSGTYLNVHTPMFGGGEIRGQVVASRSTRFTGVLSGAQEVPPNPSTGTGTVVAFLHEPENRLVYMVNSTGLANVLAAHFHQAAAGVNGPVIVTLNGTGGNYCGVSARLTAPQMTALLANGFYTNVHTNTFPGGELRAQMIRDVGDHFVAQLDGAQEVPPAATAGLGSSALYVEPNGSVTLSGQFSGLTGPAVVAHVHIAPPGAAGPIVFPLTITGSSLSATFAATPANLADLRAGNWYVNVHTAAFPGGEIRGQLNLGKLPTTFGDGCTGSNGVRPQSGATGLPVVGTTMGIDLYGALPASPVLFAFGSSRDTLGPIPLPIQLPLVGIASPDCHVFVDPTVLLVVFTNGFGCATQPLAVPFNTTLRNLEFYSQWYGLDPAASAGGFVASSALSFIIQ